MLSPSQGRPVSRVQDVNIVGGGGPIIPSTPVVTAGAAGIYLNDDLTHQLNGGVALLAGVLYELIVIPETTAHAIRGWLCLGPTAVAWSGPMLFGEKVYQIRLTTPQILSYLRDSTTAEPYKIMLTRIDQQLAELHAEVSDTMAATDALARGWLRFKTPSDTPAVTDAVSRIANTNRRLSDAPAVTDSAMRAQSKVLRLPDTAAVSDGAAPEIWK